MTFAIPHYTHLNKKRGKGQKYDFFKELVENFTVRSMPLNAIKTSTRNHIIMLKTKF